ncbi:MAG: hypothetical protein V4813_03385 [Gemmatimonadota bacterium]
MSALASNSEDTLTLSAEDENRSTTAIVSEGVLAGMIAASAVAVMFLLVDVVSAEAFRTPKLLGGLMLQLLGAGPEAAADVPTSLALYTLFHFVAFIIAGIIAASIVQVTMKQPVAILLFVILFFAFEVTFTGFVAFLDTQSNSHITPLQVAVGNIVATLAMGIFFTVRHPRLRGLGKALAAEE